MVVVDTSVWVDFLRGHQSPKTERLADLIGDGGPAALTDAILFELLRGARSRPHAGALERRLRAFPILRLADLEDFKLAAELFRAGRKVGFTIHNGIDLLIAAACVRANAPILHDDADFDRLASCTPLRVFG